MSVGLKNAGELAPQVVSLYDWALSEECNAYLRLQHRPLGAGQVPVRLLEPVYKSREGCVCC